jgi:hypothetical protein
MPALAHNIDHIDQSALPDTTISRCVLGERALIVTAGTSPAEYGAIPDQPR